MDSDQTRLFRVLGYEEKKNVKIFRDVVVVRRSFQRITRHSPMHPFIFFFFTIRDF